ncbi:YafY family protein [Rhodococcus sp. (in: high G+C Gram-positive bacteria)]|uniref:helix-turn-helix transcriptional regulator n=1 Tax=Rhodococcus sp. TaxID=1831 RepID=UPI0019DE246C|nr:YafY family protein [Rhodococcus sp. (in: high G+C Gram-positive bacteria)]MBF0663158.1 YafY family transcriptional regulator [Rhodococcus sp. (in: high G+C Gram-positive bacteria)]
MKATRLLALLLLLQTHQRVSTTELAERLEVSRRTVLRDVEALSAAGVPVYAERGRHGGIVLLPGARLNASHLEPPEMEALSIAGLDRAQLAQLGLDGSRDMADRKIAARRAATGTGPSLADLVVVDNAGWLAPQRDTASVADLALDLLNRPRLRVRYRSSGDDRASSLVVDPYGLAAKSGRWYLVADDEQRPRLFSLERLDSYETLSEPARLRSGHDLRSVWAGLVRRTETPGRVAVRARLREDRLDLAGRILGSRLEDVEPPEDGWCAVRIVYPDIESVRQLLQFGDHIEVLAPADARRRIAELASDLVRRHTPTT